MIVSNDSQSMGVDVVHQMSAGFLDLIPTSLKAER